MGPLSGIRVIEIASAAPGPFAVTLLADAGADVVRVERPDVVAAKGHRESRDPLRRGRQSIGINLKTEPGRDVLRRLTGGADVLVEGFRPGVAERLGIGPDVLCADNPALVYGRMTGWGQEGRRAPRAGHDINYIALAGALGPLGPADRPPTPPLNLVGDFGGGGFLLAFGILAALLERAHSGRGQVVDAAMVDGAALLTAHLHGLIASGDWTGPRGENLLDGGAPFYTTYETADGGFVAVGAIEEKFYERLVHGLGLDPRDLPDRDDPSTWPVLRERFAATFRTRAREQWDTEFADTDGCVTPVLSPQEAAAHPDNTNRGVFLEATGAHQPAPAPRFSRSSSGVPTAPTPAGTDTETVLAAMDIDSQTSQDLRAGGHVA